jgi:hypothetical protein
VTRDEVAAIREQLWDSGFRPVPLCNWDDSNLDEHLRGKKPLSDKWPELARENPPNCLNWPPVEHALNTGILCDGRRDFDFDIDDGLLAAKCIDLTRARLGDTSRRCRQNSSRCLLLYRAAEGEPGKLTIAGKLGKIEVLGRGQQVVVHGIHASGVPLVWTPWAPWEIRRESLPVVTEAEVIAVLTDLMPLLGAERISGLRQDGNGQDREPGEAQADPLRLAAALDDIPNIAAPDWEWWNRVGMAVWRATGGSQIGFEAFDAWSQRNPSYSAKETRARWDHYPSSPPDRIGAGSVFHMATEAREAEALALPEPQTAVSGNDAPDPWDKPTPPVIEEEPEDTSDEEDDWPAPMAQEAFHGPLGEAAQEIAPHTEADPHALLLQLLAFFGNKIGRGPYYPVRRTKHATNLYVVLGGATSRARKGTSEGEVRGLFSDVDPLDPWVRNCIQNGLSSGEGVIHAVRDERWGKDKKGNPELVDEGVTDKRLLVIESEFASVLMVMRREGNTLSPVLRGAWDHGNLQTITKQAPEKATNALVSIIGHVTMDELRSLVDRIAISNGLLNRFLFAVVRRSGVLPFGGDVDEAEIARISEQLSEAITAARLLDAVTMDAEAARLWEDGYDELTADHPGLFGSLIARSEAHVVRLALLYALADQAREIRLEHLRAALAVWKYSEASARVLFGELTGDPLADSILVFLRGAGAAGMTRTELYNAMGRNTPSSRIQIALRFLLKLGRVRRTVQITPGRTGKAPEIWIYQPGRRRP